MSKDTSVVFPKRKKILLSIPFLILPQPVIGCPRSGNWDGTVVRALISHQYGPGSILAQCHMWVKFVLGSLCAMRVFLLVQ